MTFRFMIKTKNSLHVCVCDCGWFFAGFAGASGTRGSRRKAWYTGSHSLSYFNPSPVNTLCVCVCVPCFLYAPPHTGPVFIILFHISDKYSFLFPTHFSFYCPAFRGHMACKERTRCTPHNHIHFRK